MGGVVEQEMGVELILEDVLCKVPRTKLYIDVVVGSSDITCILRDESFAAWLEVGELGWKLVLGVGAGRLTASLC